MARKQKQEERESRKSLKAKARMKRTAQNVIAYEEMYRSGICHVADDIYSAAIRFSDINFRTSREDEQIATYTKYMELLNSIGTPEGIQLIVNDSYADAENIKENILMQLRGDRYDRYRKEFNSILTDSLSVTKNRIMKEQVLVFSVREDSYEEARKTISQTSQEIIDQLATFGSTGTVMDGEERLRLMHSIISPESPFVPGIYERMMESGCDETTKDAIAPMSFEWKRDSFRIDGRHAKVLYLKNYSTELSDRFIHSIMDTDSNLTVSFHMKAVPRGRDEELIKKRIAEMELEIQGRQQDAFSKNYDPNMLPYELRTSYDEAEELLNDIKVRNQRLFECVLTVLINAPTEERMREIEKYILTKAKQHTTEIVSCMFMQEKGFNSTLPIGIQQLPYSRTLTTSAAGILMPFVAKELMMKKTEDSFPVFYGINPISHNLIMADRAKLDSPAGYILATPGSGKSFMSKMEITWQFLNTDYEIIVIDPEREYGSLCRALGGSVINVDTGHGVFLNAFDMTGISSAGEISREKVDIAMMMVTSIYGKKLDAKQQGLVERNARKMFAEYEGRICDWKDRGSAGNPPASPTLTDLAANLASDPDLEAQNLAVALEMYTGEGTYNIFGNSTSVDISNRFTVFDIRDLPETLRPLGMAVIIEMLWKRIIYNKDVRNVRTLIIIDEIYLLFKMENSAQFLQMLYKRARKYGSIVTGITQNVDELLKNDEAKTTLSNSLFTVMLNQSYEDREEVAEMYGLSATEESYISDSKAGVGLIRFGKETVPFTNIVPRNLELYKLWTTKFGENLD